MVHAGFVLHALGDATGGRSMIGQGCLVYSIVHHGNDCPAFRLPRKREAARGAEVETRDARRDRCDEPARGYFSDLGTMLTWSLGITSTFSCIEVFLRRSDRVMRALQDSNLRPTD